MVGLCQDPSALGHQLLEFGQRLGSSYPDQAERGELDALIFGVLPFLNLCIMAIEIFTLDADFKNIFYKEN